MKPIFWCCGTCKHYDRDSPADQPAGCTAFQDGIPKEISQEAFDHREPFPGDNGIRYEPLPGVNVDVAFSLLEFINREDSVNMNSHFIAFGQKVTLTDELEIQCDDKQVSKICKDLAETIKQSCGPACGDPRFYVLAEITRLTAATEVHNGFKLEEDDTNVVY